MSEPHVITESQPSAPIEVPAEPQIHREVVKSEKLTKGELGKLRGCLKLRKELHYLTKVANDLGAKLAAKHIDVVKANDELADDIARRLGFSSFQGLMADGFSLGVDPPSGFVTLMRSVPTPAADAAQPAIGQKETEP